MHSSKIHAFEINSHICILTQFLQLQLDKNAWESIHVCLRADMSKCGQPSSTFSRSIHLDDLIKFSNAKW